MNFRTYSCQLSIQNTFHRFEKHLRRNLDLCLALFPQKYSTHLGWHWPLTLGHVATHNLLNVSYLTNSSLYDVYVWLDSAFICVVYYTGIKYSCLYGQFKLQVMFLPMAVKSYFLHELFPFKRYRRYKKNIKVTDITSKTINTNKQSLLAFQATKFSGNTIFNKVILPFYMVYTFSFNNYLFILRNTFSGECS